MSDAPMVKCPMCEQPVALGANFCGTCGLELSTGRPAPVRLKWHQNIWVILFLLFFVLGPFALPMVWKHPKLSPAAKWALSMVGVAYAGLMVMLFFQLLTAVKSSLDSFNSTMPLY